MNLGPKDGPLTPSLSPLEGERVPFRAGEVCQLRANTCWGWLQATDVIILATLALFTALAVAFPSRVTGGSTLVLKNFAVAGAYLGFAALAQRASWQPLRFSLRLVPIALTYGYLFLATDSLQFLIFGGFQDQVIVDLERMIFGFQPAVWLERFVRPAVTEWMMFAYMFYFLMYPLLCGIIYFKHGETDMEHFLFTLGLTNILCDICFILLPVGGPLTGIPDQFAVPLRRLFLHLVGRIDSVRPAIPRRQSAQPPLCRRHHHVGHGLALSASRLLDAPAAGAVALRLYRFLPLPLLERRGDRHRHRLAGAARGAMDRAPDGNSGLRHQLRLGPDGPGELTVAHRLRQER